MSNCDHINDQDILNLLFIIAPQFQTTDPQKLLAYSTLLISLKCIVNCRLLGCCSTIILANMLAHYLILQNNPYMGIGTNISEGQLSIGLSSTVNGNFYESTPYGQAYLALIKNFRSTPYVSNSSLRGWHGPQCCY